MEPITAEYIREEVEKLRDLNRERIACNSRDHSKGFCGERCFTLTEHTRTDVYTGGETVVRVTHTPSGITHSHSTKNSTYYMARILCLDKLAEELRYLADPYDRD